jgi:cytochrome c-type biogenesis protein CcmE
MKPQSIFLLVALAVLMGLLMSSVFSSTSQYTDLATARKLGEEVHVVGKVDKSRPARYDPERDLFSFFLRDSLQNVAEVHYFNPRPDNFEQADRVVVAGKYTANGVFEARQILMKCPSKYKEGKAAAQPLSLR